jgi:hypothetical protein
MTPSILASALSLLAPYSGGEMPTTFSPEAKLNEGNRIEQQHVEGNQAQDSAFMNKQVDERVAVNRPLESSIYAVQPQAERSEFTSLAIYQGKQAPAFTRRTTSALPVYQDNQGKQAPMLAINAIQLENGTRSEDKQWTTAYASPERTERGLA